MYWPSRFLLFGICFSSLLSTWAQDLPPAPAQGLRDDTRALSEETRTKLAEEISACRQDLNLDLWFTASTFLDSGQTILEEARDLRQFWSPQREAVILAYDRASDAYSMSLSPGLWERYPSAQILSLLQKSALSMSDKNLSLENRVATTLRAMIQELRNLEKQRHQSEISLSPEARRLAKLLGLTFGLAAILLGGIGIANRRREMLSAWQSFFPDVQVGTRFGALHGGGVMVEKHRPER